jgi:endoglucanase
MKGLLKKVVSSIMTAVIALSVPVCIMAEDDVSSLTAQEIVDDMKIGWNLGNALDSHGFGTYTTATAAETYWSNPATTKAMIDTVKAAGFNTVRVPVTWYDRLDGDTINATWLARVKEVVDYCYANDMYVIINLHHEDSVIIPDSSHKESSESHIKNLWSQIAPYFKNYDRHLIFETLNEPRIVGSGDEWTTGTSDTRKIISEFNSVAVNTIRSTGGNNATRLIMCPSNAAKIPASDFTLPDDDNIALSVHNYSPYNFAMNADTNQNTWGSDSDKSALDSELKDLYNRYVSKGTPVVIGEMGATNKNNLSDRETWAKYYINKAKSYGITCIVWDNNKDGVGGEQFGLLKRSNCTWYFPTLITAFMNGLNDVEEVTPDPVGENSAYATDIFTGSASAAAWDQPFKTNDIPNLTEGSVIEIEYSASNAPILCLQNYNVLDGSTWTKVYADKTENGVATYSYASIVAAAKEMGMTLSDYNQLLVMSNQEYTTITRVSVVYPHKALDANNDGKEDKADAAYILNVISKELTLTDTQKTYADTNDDNSVTITDAIYVLKNLATA